MRQISLLLILLQIALFKQGKAQQCGYFGKNIFILTIHAAGSSQKIEGLKIYLVNEKNEPYTFEAIKTISDEPYEYSKYIDTLVFWENQNPTSKPVKNRGKNPNHFPVADDRYIVIIDEDENYLSNPSTTPIYKAKIVDVDGEANGGYFPTQYFYLPYAKSMNICFNHLNTAIRNNDKDYKTADGNPYNPIDIKLNQHVDLAVADAVPMQPEGMAFRILYDTLPQTDHHGEQYNIRQIQVYDLKDLRTIQTITKDTPFFVYKNLVKSTIEYMDFYNDNDKSIRDFRLPVYLKEDKEKKATITRHLHYTYNPQKKQYEKDTVLDNYENVFYSNARKQMGRKEYDITPNSYLQRIYYLQNRQWKFFETKETIRYVPPTYNTEKGPRTAKDAQCFVMKEGENYHRLTLKVAGNTTPPAVLVKDTFTFYNTCADTLYIKNVRSENRNSFTISQIILPNSKNYIYYEEQVYARTSFEFINRNLNLEFKDGTTTFVSLIIPLAFPGTNQIVFDQTNNIKRIEIPASPDFTVMEIITHPNGYLKEMGKRIKYAPQQRVDEWKQFDSTGKSIESRVYAKLVSLEPLLTTEYKKIHYKVKIRTDGKWITPVMHTHNNTAEFYMFPKTDSIVAYTDSAEQSYRIDYDKMPNSLGFQFYFLKSGEPYILATGKKMPFVLSDHLYNIKWNYRSAGGKFYGSKEEDTLFGNLLKRYPEIGIVSSGLKERAISLASLSEVRRNTILNDLQKDTTVRLMCQLFGLTAEGRFAHCDQLITVRFMSGVQPEEMRSVAAKYGFTFQRHSGHGDLFQLIYKSNLINKDFFDNFNAICKDEKVMYGNINTYMEITYDKSE